MPEELKPCPICGENKNLMVVKNNHPIAADKPYYIQCGNYCLCAGPTASAMAEAAIAAWDAFPRAPRITPNDADCKGCPERQNQGLVWTMEKPKAPGWYWYTQSDFSRPRIVQLMYRGLDTDRLVVSFAGNEENEWVEDMVGWWAGPIPMPEEHVS